MIRITEIKLPLAHQPSDIQAAIIKKLGINTADLLDYSIFKRGVDCQIRNIWALGGGDSLWPDIRVKRRQTFAKVGKCHSPFAQQPLSRPVESKVPNSGQKVTPITSHVQSQNRLEV